MCNSLLEAIQEEKRLEEEKDLEVAMAINREVHEATHRTAPVEVPNDVRPPVFKHLKKSVSHAEAREIEDMLRGIRVDLEKKEEAKRGPC